MTHTKTLSRRSVTTGVAAAVAAVPAVGLPSDASMATGETKTGRKLKLKPWPRPDRDPDITQLSFVRDYWIKPVGKKRGTSFRVFWDVAPSDDYRADCDRGHEMAEEFLRYLCDCYAYNGFSGGSILGWIANDMPPERSGLEVGFFSYIGRLAMGAEFIAAGRLPDEALA
jgi:hypothetical protein